MIGLLTNLSPLRNTQYSTLCQELCAREDHRMSHNQFISVYRILLKQWFKWLQLAVEGDWVGRAPLCKQRQPFHFKGSFQQWGQSLLFQTCVLLLSARHPLAYSGGPQHNAMEYGYAKIKTCHVRHDDSFFFFICLQRYSILVYEKGQGFTGSGAVLQDTLGYNFTGLLPGTTYYIFLHAVFKRGTGPATQISVTTLPQNLESLSSGKVCWTCVLDLAGSCSMCSSRLFTILTIL